MAAGEPDGSTEETIIRRRLFLLLLVFLLVATGAGLGSFVMGGFPGDTAGPETPTPTPVDPATPGEKGNVTLEFLGNRTLLRAGKAVPGDEGASRRAIRNSGTSRGGLAVVGLAVRDNENGIVGPEAAVDDSPEEGELSEHLFVRLSLEYPDGDTLRIYGDDEMVPLADLRARNRTVGDGLAPGETAELLFEWRLSPEAGNEIQSDSVEFDAVFELRAAEE